MLFALILLAFLLGCFPSAVIVGRLCGVNVLEQGSRNPGATNTARSAGTAAGCVVLLLDLGKGWVAAGLLPDLLSRSGGQAAALAGAAVVLGHVLNPLPRLRGGRGVATSAGALAALAPVLLAVPVLLFVALFLWRRRVSESSLVAALALPLCVWIWPPELPIALLALAFSVLICWTHRDNVRRILDGTEPRLEL